MAGIYSQGGSAGHRYAGWLSEVEAKNFHHGGKVFNGSPSAIYVGSNLVWAGRWLTVAAAQAILGAFLDDGWAVIKATNAYLTQLAAQGQAGKDKATALAGFINEDPMMVCSLGLQPQGVTMPIRWLVGDGVAHIDTLFVGFVHKEDTIEVNCKADAYPSSIAPLLGTRSGSEILLLWSANPNYYTSTGTDFQSSINCKTVVTWKFEKMKVYYDGVLNATATAQTTSVNSTLLFKGRSSGGGVESRTTSSRFSYCKIWDNDIQARYMIPMKLGKAWAAEYVSTGVAQAAGTCGMIDIVSGKFFPNANSSGSFTIPDISYTPSTP